MGKSEGEGKDWHGHVTALTVAPDYRRLGVGQQLMNHLEEVSEKGDMYFVDLFVRQSNEKACQMYKKMGYSTYRTITGYYTGNNPEDALERTNKKFISRFQYLEQKAEQLGKSLSEMRLAEMDVFWNEAKKL